MFSLLFLMCGLITQLLSTPITRENRDKLEDEIDDLVISLRNEALQEVGIYPADLEQLKLEKFGHPLSGKLLFELNYFHFYIPEIHLEKI